MTSQPKTTSGPSQRESTAGNTADTARGGAPLDRSSAEWKSQFGVLPSAYQQSGAARPSPGIVPPGSSTAEGQKRSPAAFIVGTISVLAVIGLIAYGYFPSQRAGEQKKIKGSPNSAVIASGSSVKNTLNKVAATPSPAPAKAPAAVTAKTAPVKVAVKSVPAPRPAAVTPKVVRTAVVPAPEPKIAKPEPTPQPRREKPQPPVVRSTPAPAAAVAAPRPEPKVAVARPAAKPAVKPAPPQQLPKVSRPSSDIESDGTNPLGLPQ